jgi:hypothetical protein
MRDGWKNNVVSAEFAALHKAVQQCPFPEAASAMIRRLNEVGREKGLYFADQTLFLSSHAALCGAVCGTRSL